MTKRFALGVVIAIGMLAMLGASACSALQEIRSPGVSRQSKGNYQEIVWAPDGATILALSYQAAPGTGNNIYEISFPTGDVEMVPVSSNQFSHPSWSPRGSHIAVTIGLDTIWLIDPISGTSTYVTEGEAATWSKDGRYLIVYAGNLIDAYAGERQLRIVALDGSIQQVIPLGSIRKKDLSYEYVSGLSLSGDGTQVAFSLESIVQDRPDVRETFIVDITTGMVQRFLPTEEVGPAVWAPDGQSIAYIRFRDGIFEGELIIADPAGTCLFKPELPPEIGSITWSPDGSMIAFASHGDIYVLDLASARQDAQQGEGC